MKRAYIVVVMVFLLCLYNYGVCYGYENVDTYEISYDEINRVIEDNNEKYSIDIDFNSLLEDRTATEGNGDNRKIIEKAIDIFVGEIRQQKGILKNIFFICVLSGIFKCFTDSFKSKEISETGFYVCYMAIVILMLSSLELGLSILGDITELIKNLAMAAAPVISTALLSCAEAVTGGVAAPLIIFSVSLGADFIQCFFIPAIKAAAIISIVNYLSENQMLDRLSAFISEGVSRVLRIGAIAFMAVVSIQKLSSASVDNAAVKTLGAGIGAVPVVGEVFSGAAQSITAWSGVLKTGIGVSVVIACVLSAIVPILKMLVIMLMYKVCAVLIEPFSDKRIVMSLERLGGYMGLVLSAGVTMMLMFIFSVIVFISAIGG